MPVDALTAIAQLGLGLAGFSGVAIALTRGDDGFPRFLRYRLGIMLGTTLGATFLALAPLVLVEFGMGPAASIRTASSLMALFTVGYLAYYVSGTRHIRKTVPEIVSPIAFAVVLAGHGVNLALQIGAVGGFVVARGAYLAGLMWLLLHGAYQFGRILFIRPQSRAGTTGQDGTGSR